MKTKIMQCLFLLMGTMALLTSCHKDDDVEPTPTPTPEVTKPTTYTVMLYGCGGGNLDDALDYNLNQIDAHGKADRINFTGLIKFSQPRQDEVTTEGTRLFTLTNEGLKNEKVHDANYRMDNPAHLAQFIKDTKEKMPADKYILIFWNHGEEFGISDKLPSEADYTEQPSSRSVLFDDNVEDQSLSVYEIEKAIKDSDTKMDLIYLDVCNMGMAEVNYQLKDCTKYLMAASAITPSIGGNYSELLDDLQANDSLADAIKEYVPNCMKNWKNANTTESQEDLECYDLSYMDEFAVNLKGAVDEFKNILQDASEKQKVLDAEYDGVVCYGFYGMYMGLTEYLHIFDGNNISVDVCSAFSRIANLSQNGTLSHYATQMKRTLDKMTVAHGSNYLPNWMDEISMGMLWPTNMFVSILRIGEYNLADNLRNAALYQATGWGDLLANLNNPLTYKITTPLETDIYIPQKYRNRRKYTWQYDFEILEWDETVDKEDVEWYEIAWKNDIDSFNSLAEKHPVGLFLGKLVFDEVKEKFLDDDPSHSYKAMCGVKKMKLKAYVKGGVKPNEPEQDKFSAEIEKVIDLEEDATYK